MHKKQSFIADKYIEVNVLFTRSVNYEDRSDFTSYMKSKLRIL